MVTEACLKLTNGEMKVGNDADLYVFNEELNLYDVIAKGEFCVKDEKVVKRLF